MDIQVAQARNVANLLTTASGTSQLQTPLSRLPPEIRKQIYGELITTSDIQVSALILGSSTYKPPSLFLTSRAFCAEAKDHLLANHIYTIHLYGNRVPMFCTNVGKTHHDVRGRLETLRTVIMNARKIELCVPLGHLVDEYIESTIVILIWIQTMLDKRTEPLEALELSGTVFECTEDSPSGDGLGGRILRITKAMHCSSLELSGSIHYPEAPGRRPWLWNCNGQDEARGARCGSLEVPDLDRAEAAAFDELLRLHWRKGPLLCRYSAGPYKRLRAFVCCIYEDEKPNICFLCCWDNFWHAVVSRKPRSSGLRQWDRIRKKHPYWERWQWDRDRKAHCKSQWRRWLG